MKYKHFYIGRKCFANLYRRIDRHGAKWISRILKYKNPTIIVWEVKFNTWAFDLGYNGAKKK